MDTENHYKVNTENHYKVDIENHYKVNTENHYKVEKNVQNFNNSLFKFVRMSER